MEKKLKKVQRGAAFGFVVLKILRILLIIAAVLMIAGLVFLAVVNENDLPLEGVSDGKLLVDLEKLDLDGTGLDRFLDLKGELNLDLRDAKLAVMLLVGVGILALAASYVLLLIAGKLFKHMKNESTPFTAGNVARLRLLGVLHIVYWTCGIVLSYFVTMELVRRLALPVSETSINLNISSFLLSLVYFFLARVFNFGKAQGEALQEYLPAPAPAPEFEVEPAPAVEPAPVYAAPKPLYQEPIAPQESAPAPLDPPTVPEE